MLWLIAYKVHLFSNGCAWSGLKRLASPTVARSAGGTPSKSTSCSCPNHSTMLAILGAHSIASSSVIPSCAIWARRGMLGGSIPPLVLGVDEHAICLAGVLLKSFAVWLTTRAERITKEDCSMFIALNFWKQLLVEKWSVARQSPRKIYSFVLLSIYAMRNSQGLALKSHTQSFGQSFSHTACRTLAVAWK